MKGAVVTVGTFDGVQRGHQTVFAEVIRRGRASGLADRVAGIDGTLRVDSPANGPTSVRAELPCA